MTTTTRSRPSRRAADAACLTDAAIELARAAAVEMEGPDAVGEHRGHEVEGGRVVTHSFACTMPAYRGWRWAVTITRAARAKVPTVSEVVLLPDDGALLAPPWVPWAERLRPGDLGPGDVLPTAEDDPRLVPGFTGADEQEAGASAADEAAELLGPIGWELGLGRVRVLSREGRDEAADRWYAGEGGPGSAIAKAAPATCSSCGFLVPLGGALAQMFGACANVFSPSDGKVVSLDHGCGAHSEVAVTGHLAERPEPILDEVGYDVVVVEGVDHPEGSVTAEESPAEELGHS